MRAEPHAALKKGLSQLYELLIEMRYLHPDQVDYPPYPPILREPWAALRLDPLSIDLMQELPYVKGAIGKGPLIMPDSWCYQYAGPGAYTPMFNSRNLIFDDDLLSPLDLAVINTSLCGKQLIYDLRDETVRELTLMNKENYRSLPKRPVEDVFEELIDNYRSLRWIPVSPSPRLYEVMTEEDALRERTNCDFRSIPRPDQTEAEKKQADLWFFRSKNHANQYFTVRKMYRDCGWPEAFDGEKWQREWDEFCRSIDLQSLMAAPRFQSTLEQELAIVRYLESIAGVDAAL